MNIKKRTNTSVSTNKGFTLIETFIAITILIMAVAGPLTIAQESLSSSEYSQEHITAYYLAQDALEYVREVRDNLALAGDESNTYDDTNWLGYGSDTLPANMLDDGISTCFVVGEVGTGCTMNDLVQISNLGLTSSANKSFQPCASSACSLPNLYYDPTLHEYTYESTCPNGDTCVATPYTRKISIVYEPTSDNSSTNEALVTVTVSWQTAVPGQGNSVTLTDDLYNWH